MTDRPLREALRDARALAEGNPRWCSEEALAEALYVRHFARGHDTLRMQCGDPHFVSQLWQAARGTHVWERGFKLLRKAGPGERWAFVTDGRLTLFLDDGRDFRAGRLKLPAAREGELGGYFTLVSRAGRPSSARTTTVFLHLSAEAAPALVELLAHHGRARRLKFVARVRNEVAGYPRANAAWVECEPAGQTALLELLRQVEVAGSSTPVFTHWVRRGVALARHPAGQDVGRHRCRLAARVVAEAVSASWPFVRMQREVERALASQTRRAEQSRSKRATPARRE